MKFIQPFHYTEEVTPHRCRKPRPVGFEGQVEVEVRQVSPSEAPVVVRVREPWSESPKLHEYRFFEGRFFLPMHQCQTIIVHDPDDWRGKQVPAPRTFDPKANQFRFQQYGTDTEAGWVDRIHQDFDRYLIVGRTAHIAVGEPRWCISTFGLGHNHGFGDGTSLSVDTYYNSNIPHTRYFRLDREREAVAEATRIAKGRGDTKALPMKTFERVTIQDPSILRVDPAQDHGDGDSFINGIESLIQNTDSAGEAGLLVVLATVQHAG